MTKKRAIIALTCPHGIWQLAFCLACSAIALGIALYVTRAGINISWDSTTYINTAKNILDGRGFVSAGNQPYVLWPPMYPMMIAGLMYLGVGVEQAARIIPVLAYALTMFPLFFLCKMATRNALTPYITSLVYLAFVPLLWISSWALTDTPYIFFSMMAVWLLALFVRSEHKVTTLLVLAGLFTALATLTRFIGMVFLPVALIAILAKNISWGKSWTAIINLKQTVTQAVLYILVGFLPLFAWQVYHARSFNPGWLSPVTNIYRILHAIWVDFLGSMPLALACTLVAILALSLVILAVRRRLPEYLKDNFWIIAYLIFYLVGLIFIESVERTEPINTRYVSPIYPFLIILAVPLILQLPVLVKQPWVRQALFSASLVILILFAWFQGNSFQSYRENHGYGDTMDSVAWEQSVGISWMSNHLPADAVIYSDATEPLQWKLGRTVYPLPSSTHATDASIDSFFNGIAGQKDAFVVCLDTQGTPLIHADQVIEANTRNDILVEVTKFSGSTI